MMVISCGPGANVVGVLVIYASTFLVTIAFTIFETSGPLYVAEDPYIKFSVFYTSLMFGLLALVALLSIAFLRVVMIFFKNDRINLVAYDLLPPPPSSFCSFSISSPLSSSYSFVFSPSPSPFLLLSLLFFFS